MKILISNMLPDLIEKTCVDTYSQEDMDFYVSRLAIPHATMMLIRTDYECGKRDAHQLSRSTAAYGAHEYPLTAQCPTLERLRGVSIE